jgi:hypothetical protein
VSSRFVVHVAVTHFVLDGPRAGRSALTGHGLLGISLDGGRFDEPQYSGLNGRMALDLAVNGYYSPAYKPTITYSHIPPGHHTLEVKLLNRNETPTGTSTTVQFIVR